LFLFPQAFFLSTWHCILLLPQATFVKHLELF
jgi:hypothetical protein